MSKSARLDITENTFKYILGRLLYVLLNSSVCTEKRMKLSNIFHSPIANVSSPSKLYETLNLKFYIAVNEYRRNTDHSRYFSRTNCVDTALMYQTYIVKLVSVLLPSTRKVAMVQFLRHT